MAKSVKFFSLFILLFVGASLLWAQDATTIYLASLKVQKSPASIGDGQVRLTWLDIKGKPMASSIAVGSSGLNPTNPTPGTGFAATAQMLGGTLFAIDGMEQPIEIQTGSQIYMTSFLYFHPEAQAANGSYLADWTFAGEDAKYLSRMDEPMGNLVYDNVWDDDLQDWVDVVNEEESIPLRYPCFKLLPDEANNALYPSAALQNLMQTVSANPNNIYAVFNKYILSNPVAVSTSVDAQVGQSKVINVSVDVEGDATTLDDDDFASAFTFTNNTNGEWSYDKSAITREAISDQKTKVTIPVTFTYKAATGQGTKKTVLNVSMAGSNPSFLNISLAVDALDPARPEALWFDGKTEITSGTLSDMLNVNIGSYKNPILRINKPVASALTFSGNTFTLDLNGNETQAITVSGGEITIAYSKFGGSATSLNVTGGKVILNGGTFGSLTIGANGTVEQNGATITGATTNNGTLTTIQGEMQGGLTSSKTLTMDGGVFKGATAVTVSGGTATINRATIIGATCGLKVSGGNVTLAKLAAITGGTYAVQRTAGTLTVNCGKFGAPLNGAMTFVSGYFKENNYGISTDGKTEFQVPVGVEYNEGYRYFLGTAESAATYGVGACRIGNVSYAKLEDAIAFANNNPSLTNLVIFMTNNYTLPAGFYTLPANATIVVPMSDSQAKETNINAPRVVYNDVQTAMTYVEPTEFRRLTFASGVNMDVFGQIELTCSQFASNEAYTSQPYGPYGRLVLEEGSHITLQGGSQLRAWGFVTGKGEIDARRNSKVREMFQMGDWKGAMTSVRITGMVKQDEVSPALWNKVGADDSGYKIFPVSQYFIQNVESPVKYHPGAVLSTSAAVSEGLIGMSVSMAATDIKVVGVDEVDQAIFLMNVAADAENTWVRKWYDAENDIQVYDINSGARIGSMVLDMGDVNLLTFGTVPIRLNSAKFDLPLTCNFKIHLLTGEMDFKQNTSLLPGAEVEVDKEATVTVAKDSSDPEHTGAVYVYDAAEWDKYAFICSNESGTGKAYTKVVRYAPSWNGRPTKRNEQVCPPSAAINVHGTFRTDEGYVYTSASGANIFSNNEDAGTFIFEEDASEAGERTVYQVKGRGTYESQTFYSAKLKHGNGTHEDTSTAEEGDAYCYQNDFWTIMKVDEHDDCFMVDNLGNFYAKPADYVAVVATKDPSTHKITGNSDHTFSDAAGAGRLFILMKEDCQWWEVEKKDNLYHCIHPDNDTYYYWDNSSSNVNNHKWKEKTFTITWKNWDGTIIKTVNADGQQVDKYSVTYGTMAEFLGKNPTRDANIDYTYDFTGWSPALGPVTSDVTYTATYTEKPRKYTITFCEEGGSVIETQFLTHNEVPVCENTPTRIGYTLEWSPAISAVTGDATYTAVWHEEPPTEYQITFFDYNGTTVLQQGNVKVGVVPTPPANPSGKPQTSEFNYVFDHWSPALEEVSATSIKSYTAVYREDERTYTISYYNEVGNSVINTESLPYGATPTPPVVTKENPAAGHTYTLVWKTLDGKNTIQTVMGNAAYKPTYIDQLNKYTITVKSNPSGACSISGAGLYEYNTSATLTLTVNEGYTFNGWSDGQEETNTTRVITVTEDKELVANFTVEDPDYTITWKSENGSVNLVTPVGQKAGTATIFTGAIPTKPETAAKSYTFYGWSTAANGGGTIYKNGMTPKATANATYYAYFKEEARKYNILWKNEAGTSTIEQDLNQPYGAKIAYNSATPTKQATAQYTFAFDGWSTSVGGDVVAVPATVSGEATFYAHFAATTKTYTITFIRDDGSLIDQMDVAYGTVPTHDNPTKPATAQYFYSFAGWNKPFETVTGLATYKASFSEELNKYTVVWQNEDGTTLETDKNVPYGTNPSYNGATPTKEATAEYTYTFDGWTPVLSPVTGNITYTATFKSNPIAVVVDLEIGVTDKIVLTEPTTNNNLIITSNGTASGQLIGAENLTLTGDAYFDLALAGGVKGNTWYAIAVPWQVDTKTGLYTDKGKLTIGSNCRILYFDATRRAKYGRNTQSGTREQSEWQLVSDGDILSPGQLYMIRLNSAANKIRFQCVPSASLVNDHVEVELFPSQTGSDEDANWNGIANPTTYYAWLNAYSDTYGRPHFAQKYIPGEDRYEPFNMSANSLVVGQPVFIQATSAGSVVVANQNDKPSYAAHRRQAATISNQYYNLQVSMDGHVSDQLYILAEEDKADQYEIGADLAKSGVSSKVPQMWVNRYNTKLCVNTTAYIDDVAQYPLSIFTPKEGEYEIRIATAANDDTNLYLTYDGQTIWNLSYDAYIAYLPVGTDNHYGLRIAAKAPQTATDVEEAIVDSKDVTVTKVLINGRVFIIRGENVYSIDGRLVK